MRRVLGLLVLVLLTAPWRAAAAVTLSARLEPSRVVVGEASDLAVTVNGAQNAPAPTLTPPDGITIRYIGPETQVSIVNGQMSSSITHHYQVVAQREGMFAVGPITLDYEGTTLGAGSPRLTVRAAPTGAPAGGEQLRLVLEAPKTTVYLHERLPLSLTLWVGNTRVSDLQYPVVPGDGFAIDPFGEPSQRQVRTAEGGFQLVDFATTLVPLRAGTLTVGPATMALAQVTQQGRRGFFLGAGRQPIELRSEPLTLEVLPLPDAGRPADFGGAVGKFSLDVAAAPRDLVAGDPVTLTITVRGTGALEGAATPAVAERPGLKVYPVQPAAQQPPAASGEVARVFEQVVIPQEPGTVTLPPVRLAYFDPEARAYRVAQHGPIVLAVRPPAPGTEMPQVVGGRPAAPAPPTAPAEPLGRDLVFIKDAPGTLAPVGARRWTHPVFWLFQLLPLAAWGAVVGWTARRQRLGSDARFARFSAAGRTARTALAAARARLQRGDRAGCVDGVAQAVTAYLSAKLDLPPGSVGPERAGERLQGTRVGPAVVDELRALLATCERVRFAPGSSADGDAERALAQAEGIVRTLERERRLGRGLGASAALVLLALAVAPPLRAQTTPTPAVAPAAKPPVPPAPRAEDTPQTAFFRGNAAYADGRFPEAAAAYEQVLASGVESGPTYYNLGNARLRAGDVGGAVWAYERAHRLLPRDADVGANLGFARAAGTSPPPPPLWARALFPFAALATSDELALGTAIAWWLFLGLLIAARLAPTAARPLRRVAVAVGIAGVVVLLSFGWRLATVDLRDEAVVIAPSEVTVRFEPSPTGTSHFTAAPGSVLRVLGAREGWRQVARGDGARGWVEASALAEL